MNAIKPPADAPGTTPIAAPLCPLCGQPNQCVPAGCGTFDAPCWCAQVPIPAEVLARIPDAQRGKACVCRACAERGAAS